APRPFQRFDIVGGGAGQHPVALFRRQFSEFVLERPGIFRRLLVRHVPRLAPSIKSPGGASAPRGGILMIVFLYHISPVLSSKMRKNTQIAWIGLLACFSPDAYAIFARHETRGVDCDPSVPRRMRHGAGDGRRQTRHSLLRRK